MPLNSCPDCGVLEVIPTGHKNGCKFEGKDMLNIVDLEFIRMVESSHFRTNQDTGAHRNTLLIWNLVRKHFGLDPLLLSDLPKYCKIHGKYHKILVGYGCEV